MEREKLLSRLAHYDGERHVLMDAAAAYPRTEPSRIAAARNEALEEAQAIVAKHVQRARDAVAECDNWSAAQAEWSRARDLGLDIADDLATAIRALKGGEG